MAKRLTIYYATYVYDERMHRGILHYGRSRGWRVQLLQPHAWSLVRGMKPDGLISLMEPDDDTTGMTDYVLSLGVPHVDLSYNRPEVEVPRFLPDLEDGGRQAAEHLAMLGVSSLRCVQWGETIADELRMRGFLESAEEGNLPVECLNMRHCKKEPHQSLLNFLKSAPKPVGVFCSVDQYAGRVLDICLDEGWRVPEDVAILGFYNHEIDSALAEISLSSVDIDIEGRGYKAAQALGRMIRGEDVPVEQNLVPIKGIVCRASTTSRMKDDRFVAGAQEYISSNLRKPLTVEELVGAVGMSRAALQRRFKRVLGHGVAAEIKTQKMAMAKRMLRQGDETATYISEELGFPDVTQFYRVFKRETGETVGQFRKRSR